MSSVLDYAPEVRTSMQQEPRDRRVNTNLLAAGWGHPRFRVSGLGRNFVGGGCDNWRGISMPYVLQTMALDDAVDSIPRLRIREQKPPHCHVGTITGESNGACRFNAYKPPVTGFG